MASYKRLKFACYSVNITMAAIGSLSPLLFLTFRSLYGISYSLLGLLVLINFFTQLGIDLLFSFFSHKFNISKAVKLTPVLSVIGLAFASCTPNGGNEGGETEGAGEFVIEVTNIAASATP